MNDELVYESLSKEISDRIVYDREHGTTPDIAFKNRDSVRRDPSRDIETVWRPAFVRDVDKILHSPFYNRYADKTQVFSFYKNDDISRRALHVQLVSRIARTIGAALGLNLDLIEAIALGHDIGHTPFGHAGERYLNEVYHAETGRYFNHNVHSVRVLDKIFPLNLTLQTLNGILTHNGEFELAEYRPRGMSSFKEFDALVESCYINEDNIRHLIPSTLEGCVVRVCDMIAYIGKDRQDAMKAKLIPSDMSMKGGSIGTVNAEIINNLVVNVIENSYGKDYIMLDEEHYNGLREAKRINYDRIYHTKVISELLDGTVKPIMQKLYYRLLDDVKRRDTESIIWRQHVMFVKNNHYKPDMPYEEEEPNQIVADFIASMTDDYCTDLYCYLFPEDENRIKYNGYFGN